MTLYFNLNAKKIKKNSIDLSSCNIVYDQLGIEIRSENKLSRSGLILASEVANYLKSVKGKFTCLNLADNILSDEGLKIIVQELITHDCLEKVNFCKNKISDTGLNNIIPLFNLENLRVVIILNNYVPSDETIKFLKGV